MYIKKPPAMSTEGKITEHWTHGSLAKAIMAALVKAGVDTASPSVRDLEPLDHLHGGGAEATASGVRSILAAVDRLNGWLTSLLSYLDPAGARRQTGSLAGCADNALALLAPKLAITTSNSSFSTAASAPAGPAAAATATGAAAETPHFSSRSFARSAASMMVRLESDSAIWFRSAMSFQPLSVRPNPFERCWRIQSRLMMVP